MSEKKCQVYEDNDLFIFECPNCNEFIEVEKKETNCCIFRHAVYKHNMNQVSPHTPKNMCDRLVNENKVIGCCRPFRFIYDKNGNYVKKCGYI